MSEYITDDLDVASLRFDLGVLLRTRVREAIQVILDEELTAALGSGWYERVASRMGYRNGSERRCVTTESGPMELDVPRGRMFEEDGSTREFRSQLLPRYARRTRPVDQAILGTYLGGTNTRRIKRALGALFGKSNLSKSAVSRIVGRLEDLFAKWDQRDLSEEYYPVLFLDAVYLKVRLVRKVVSAPVLVVLGVLPDGQRRVVAMRLAASEAGHCWGDLVKDLQERGLRAPMVIVSDGHPGLLKAIEVWPEARVQRCTRHKLANLYDHCPKHAHTELRRDYHEIVYAEDYTSARRAYDTFIEKWSRLCKPVARSLQEGGGQLLTFYELPKPLWRSLRTTNTLENLNREFRRRTKTQGSFSNEKAAVTLVYGLLAFGQVRLRRIDGYQAMPNLLADLQTLAA